MVTIASHNLGIKPEHIRLMNTRTDKVPNTSATAASSGTDLNGAAIKNACDQITARLRKVVAKHLDLADSDIDKIVFNNGLCLAPGKDPVDIVKVINWAYADRVQLSVAGYYATPDISPSRSSKTPPPKPSTVPKPSVNRRSYSLWHSSRPSNMPSSHAATIPKRIRKSTGPQHQNPCFAPSIHNAAICRMY